MNLSAYRMKPLINLLNYLFIIIILFQYYKCIISSIFQKVTNYHKILYFYSIFSKITVKFSFICIKYYDYPVFFSTFKQRKPLLEISPNNGFLTYTIYYYKYFPPAKTNLFCHKNSHLILNYNHSHATTVITTSSPLPIRLLMK